MKMTFGCDNQHSKPGLIIFSLNFSYHFDFLITCPSLISMRGDLKCKLISIIMERKSNLK